MSRTRYMQNSSPVCGTGCGSPGYAIADEDADPNLPPDDVLRADYEAPTPIVVPGARTIRTQDLAVLLEHRKPLVVDVIAWGKSVPGAIGLWGAGIGGSTTDEFQERLGQKMQ